ncbi:MAG: thiol-disulfide isomerase/thioredoxin [Myxococcota bacterium]|jgi:thiol-disulfide isomerase/thioredoxin
MLFGLFLSASSLAAEGDTWAFLINGGAKPQSNYQSHVIHLEEMYDVLMDRGVDPDRVVVFSADGPVTLPDQAVLDDSLMPDDAAVWEGTRTSRMLPQVEIVDTDWTRSPEIKAARKPVIAEAFAEAAAKLGPGDTLFVYTTDHGSKDGAIKLWREDATVAEMRAWFAGFDPGVRLVVAMSQCYSGAFADAVLPGEEASFPDACGLFSVPPDKRAYGCFPEGRDKFIGHGFRLIDAMGRHDRLSDAHLEVLITDRTPDIPLRSSDAFLARRLEAEAARTSADLDELVDALLERAWKDRSAYEAEIRRLDDIAETFGTFSPRSLAELERASSDLRDAAKAARTYASRWDGARTFAAKEVLRRFEDAHPEWTPRLDKEPAAELTKDERMAAMEALLPVLRGFVGESGQTDRLAGLARTEAQADGLQWRMTSRDAAMARMRWLLLRIAGTVLVEGTPDAPTLKRLVACEATAVGMAPGRAVRDEPEWPDADADLAGIDAVAPSWLGVRYTALTTDELLPGLQRGAARVTGVMEGSPAEIAGIEVDDILTGPPDAPFDEPQALRLWAQAQPRGEPVQMMGWRGDETRTFALEFVRYPTKLPDLVRPQEGDPAPPVEASFHRLGSSGPLQPLAGQRHLLFWWATWCGPCKLAVPELLAWSAESGVPVVAITDEGDEEWTRFAAKWTDPFPELTVADEGRASWAAYGVSATPTFVLVAPDGTVEWRQRGYSKNLGLSLPGWSGAASSP